MSFVKTNGLILFAAIFLHSAICEAQDTPHRVAGEWIGDIELAKAHYDAKKAKMDPMLVEQLDSMAIEFKPDNTLQFKNRKAKVDQKSSYKFLSSSKKNEFSIEVSRGNGLPLQTWNCKFSRIKTQEVIILSIKGLEKQELVLKKKPVEMPKKGK